MSRKQPLAGAAALITGASAGIGHKTALQLAADGADVALAARSEDRLNEIVDEIRDGYGVEAIAVRTDIRNQDAVVEAVETAVETFDGLDVLVSNAGIASPGFDNRFEEVPVSEYERVLETNVYGTFYATHAALPALRESKGNLVFVGSSAGKLPRPSAPIYAATKWWLRGFALSIEAEAGQDGVAVTVVNPTAVRTDIWPNLEPGEAAEPEEVADVIAFVARQAPHTTLSEVDLFRRDMLGKFVPRDIDLDLAYEPKASDR